jgi:hypothetical protein
MELVIPGELLTVCTFPGVIFHEVAHRFFCDWYNVRVYEIQYFLLWNKESGYVIHEPTENISHVAFIALGPLIINSLICMLLTIPNATEWFLGTEFVACQSMSFLKNLMTWVGYSAGLHAIPSKQDVAFLSKLAESKNSKILIILIRIIIFFNEAGFLLQLLYVYCISLILPVLFCFVLKMGT